jgi:small subunit ribosomal protein S4e
MVKNHLKVLVAPKTWPIERKCRVWVTRPNSGAHKLQNSLSLNTVLKDILNLAETRKEVNYILSNQQVLVDGKRRKDKSFAIGLMDTLALPLIQKYYRMSLNSRGKICLVDISEHESKVKPVKILNKTYVKGRLNLNTDDGRNIIADKESYKTGNTLLIELPGQKIHKQISLKKGAQIFLTGGKHLGEVGKVEDIQNIHIIFKTHSKIVKTLTKYALAIGEDQPEVKVIN